MRIFSDETLLYIIENFVTSFGLSNGFQNRQLPIKSNIYANYLTRLRSVNFYNTKVLKYLKISHNQGVNFGPLMKYSRPLVIFMHDATHKIYKYALTLHMKENARDSNL